MLQIEFGGKDEVLGFLLERGYVVFDNECLLMSLQADPIQPLGCHRNRHLIDRGLAYNGWPKTLPADPAAFCEMFREEAARIKGHVYTDLVAVAPGVRGLLG